MRQLTTIILAAGKSTRMRSTLPKVLCEIAGQPLLQYCIDLAREAGSVATLAVVGHKAEEVIARFSDSGVRFVIQKEQRGTAHAAASVEEHLRGFDGDFLVLYGDVPLIRPETVRDLILEHRRSGAALTLLTAESRSPSGYGRVVRAGAEGKISKIVEEIDLSPEERSIAEINSGICCFKARFLFKAVKAIKADNLKGEYYLTDAVEIAAREGEGVAGLAAGEDEIIGINSQNQLDRARGIMSLRINRRLVEEGVSLRDPGTTRIDLKVAIGRGTSIGGDTSILGLSEIGAGCAIGSNCTIADSKIGDGSKVGDFSSIERCDLKPGSVIEPHTVIADMAI